MTSSPTAPAKPSLTDLQREITRLNRARHTMPLGGGRDAVIERLWVAHRERAHRLCLLALAAGFPLS